LEYVTVTSDVTKRGQRGQLHPGAACPWSAKHAHWVQTASLNNILSLTTTKVSLIKFVK